MNDSDINQQELEEQIKKAMEGMSPDEAKEVFIESLILEKYSGNDELDEGVIEELKSDLEDKLDVKVNDKLMAVLPEDKVDELDAIIDGGGDPEKIREMLAGNGVDVDKLVAEAMKELHDEYLGGEAGNEEE